MADVGGRNAGRGAAGNRGLVVDDPEESAISGPDANNEGDTEGGDEGR